MTVKFRLDAFQIDTANGPVTYEFASPLTVLAGDVGVGKSTLLELIKYTLGGDALLAEVVEASVLEATATVTVGRERFEITRGIAGERTDIVRVRDLVEQRQLDDHSIDGAEPTLNSLLLAALGIEDDLKAASRSKSSTRAGNRISFADIFKYMYISQAEINRDIAMSTDSYYNPKRLAVFELLFGITNPEILGLRSGIARLRGEKDEAANEAAIVQRFLGDSGTESRFEAELALSESRKVQRAASTQIAELRQAMAPAIDRETQTLRDLLGAAERSLAEARDAHAIVTQQVRDYLSEQREVALEVGRLERMIAAGERIASIEFAVCPRCMQSVRERPIEPSHCRLCLQPDPTTAITLEPHSSGNELAQLQGQIGELDSQIEDLRSDARELSLRAREGELLVEELSASIAIRTEERVTPQLQAYGDASANLAEARAQEAATEKILQLWDQAARLEHRVQAIESEMQRSGARLQELEIILGSKRKELFDELDSEFASTVHDIGIPGVRTASINRETYLPVLNGKPFAKFSPVGGVRTATQLAYWVTLMTVALRLNALDYPTFLLIDSPRTSLNDSADLSAALYRRLVLVADSAGDRVQLIVADNALPASYRRDYTQLDFDYDHPTISTVRHPGRDAVQPIITAPTGE